MSNWRKDAKKLMAGRWVRFDAETPEIIVTFEGEPQIVTKTAQTGNNKGEEYQQLSFPVSVDGEPKLLEPNRSLLAYIVEEDTQEEVIGRTFKIKCLDLKTKRQWKMTAVNDSTTQGWTGKKAQAQEEEEEKKPKANKKAKPKDKDKEKFMEEVKKVSKKKAEELTPADRESDDDDDNGRSEETSEAEKDSME